MLEDITDNEALLLLKRSNTAHEEIFTIRRSHVQIFGDFSTPSVLGRIIYWSGKSRLPDGWFYKTAEEMAQETGLSVRTIHRAKTILETMDVIETAVHKINEKPTLHWRIKPKNLLELELNHTDNAKLLDLMVSDNMATTISDTVAITDNDTVAGTNIKQTNTINNSLQESIIDGIPQAEKKVKKTEGEFVMPDWSPKKQWDEFCKTRKGDKKFTDYAKELAVGKLKTIMDATGASAVDIINQTIESGWKTFYPLKGGQGNGTNRQHTQKGKDISANGKSTKYAGLHQEPIGEE